MISFDFAGGTKPLKSPALRREAGEPYDFNVLQSQSHLQLRG
jgi:hypothetical protein